jgi:hypothetical protein
MFATLATQLDDPVDRLLAARDVMSGAKLVHEDIGGNTLHEWAEVAAPVLFSRGMRLYERLLEGRHPPIINLVVSNVPGPSFPLYCAGARLVSLFPLRPTRAACSRHRRDLGRSARRARRVGEGGARPVAGAGRYELRGRYCSGAKRSSSWVPSGAPRRMNHS